jgi:hypothetical protein
MIVGADVTHPSPDQNDIPSVAAVCTCTFYFLSCVHQVYLCIITDCSENNLEYFPHEQCSFDLYIFGAFSGAVNISKLM